MACRAQRGVIFCQLGIKVRRIGGNRSLKFRQIKPGTPRSLCQMIAAVPTCDGSIPKQARHFVGKGQPVAEFSRRDAQAAKACGKGLVGRYGQCDRVLVDRVGDRPVKGHVLKRSCSRTVGLEVGAGQRVHPGEISRITDCGGMHDAQIDRNVEVALQTDDPWQQDIGIGAAKRPVKINRERHRYPLFHGLPF